MTSVTLKIQQIFGELNETEQRIANYIMSNESGFVHDSISALSKKTATSQAAIVRFCKRIGFAGLKDVKRSVIIEMTNPTDKSLADDEHYSDIKTNDSIANVVEKIMANHIKSLDDTRKIMEYDVLDGAVTALQNAEQVCFYGTGASGLVAADAQQKFMRVGKRVNHYTESHLMISSAATLKPGDVAVLISNSGRTRELIEVLEVAKAVGATTISITKYGSNPLSDHTDYPMYIATTEITMRSGATSSRIAQLSLIDILFIGYAGRNYDEIHHRLEQATKYYKDKLK